MELLLLLLLPATCAILSLLCRSEKYRPLFFVLGATGHAFLSFDLISAKQKQIGWLGFDPPAFVVLCGLSILFLICSIYTISYLQQKSTRKNRIFVASLCGLEATLTLAVLAQHLGLLWIAIETSALIAGPLIYFNRSPRAIEATWKYLMVGGVGVALALLGTFCMAYSALYTGHTVSLRLDDLYQIAPELSKPWLLSSVVLLFIGYGTKMGLAPMHAWKPDTYGEAPGLVGAIFAGGFTAVAFLALIRVMHIAIAAGYGSFCFKLCMGVGLLSMGLGAAMTIWQCNLKRMLAWSSVEQMGLMTLGVGLGGSAAKAVFLALIGNILCKSCLFLVVGNVQQAYGSNRAMNVSGMLKKIPWTGWTLIIGFLAMTGAPPFLPFFAEVRLAQSCFGNGQYVVGTLYLLALLVIFMGMGKTVLNCCLGEPPEPVSDPKASMNDSSELQLEWQEHWMRVSPPILLLLGALLVGFMPPQEMLNAFTNAAAWMGGNS